MGDRVSVCGDENSADSVPVPTTAGIARRPTILIEIEVNARFIVIREHDLRPVQGRHTHGFDAG